jgi:hypothetical protein
MLSGSMNWITSHPDVFPIWAVSAGLELCRVDLVEAASRYKTMEARRRFIAALGATALATPLRAFAQQTSGKIPRIGVLLFNSPQIDPVAPLIEGLQALGYVDGKPSRSNTGTPTAKASVFRRSPRNWCSSNPI